MCKFVRYPDAKRIVNIQPESVKAASTPSLEESTFGHLDSQWSELACPRKDKCAFVVLAGFATSTESAKCFHHPVPLKRGRLPSILLASGSTRDFPFTFNLEPLQA